MKKASKDLQPISIYTQTIEYPKASGQSYFFLLNMNLFLLNLCIKLCADQICNKHLIKMILETTQMAYSTQQGNGDDDYIRLFQKELKLK